MKVLAYGMLVNDVIELSVISAMILSKLISLFL